MKMRLDPRLIFNKVADRYPACTLWKVKKILELFLGCQIILTAVLQWPSIRFGFSS